MKWQQRVRVATGLGCWQIMLHLLVVAMLVIGWMSGTLVRVGLGLCVLYGVTVLLMLALQRHHEQRWRDVADVLEELTTTWYFGTALIVLWLLSRVLQNNVLKTKWPKLPRFFVPLFHSANVYLCRSKEEWDQACIHLGVDSGG
ncbi:hypothetical protein MJL90_21535, partial [Salmonella enterica subsp. enterica serovar Anatum]|nr:hypothetical protein [Salmonella enterica subsp. enterica serovar Anatum]